MIVELALSVVVGFVIVVVGSYVGAKMALNTFFGRDFDASEHWRSTDAEPNAGSDGTDR